MFRVFTKQLNRFNRAAVCALAVCGIAVISLPARSQEKEPIAYTGHGAFFDQQGEQIVPTEEFVRNALAWYREDLLRRVPDDKRASYEKQRNVARNQLRLDEREDLVLESRTIDWLMENATKQAGDDRKQGKLNALRYVLQFELPKNAEDKFGAYVKPIELRPEFEENLRKLGFGRENISVFSVTTNFGQAYNTECKNNGVPMPPPIGSPLWTSQGFIPNNELFIANTVVEVMTFKSANPEGMCIALPRANDAAGNQVALDGVICLGKKPSPISGKSTTCFWDNQMNGTSFTFTKGTMIPIGFNDPVQVPNNPSGRFMSGGVQLTSSDAGMCTDCHAGQNPYVIHPRNPSPQKPGDQAQNPAAETTLGKLSKPPLNLPTFGDTRYDPLVAANWPQNNKSLNDIYVPGACTGCHTGGTGGRLPHLSTELSGYCDTVLKKALRVGIPHSMPQFSPGSAAGDADVGTLINLASVFDPSGFCGLGPTAGPSNRGDPHIVTTNNVNFDFQASGEFTALKDQDAPFELQTRQTPVLTSFTPGAHPYTGLATCVSLNSAVALQMGKHRVTYQPPGKAGPTERVLELRIDGKLATLNRGSVRLSEGFAISANGGSALTFHMSDGTKIIVTPQYWSSQGYWFMDVEVLRTSAKAGIMGHISSGEWLPRGGDGSNFGPMPASLSDRFTVLYRKFADTWRVNDQTSLFDYPAGLTTRDFTDPDWATEGANCQSSIIAGPKVEKQLEPDVAKRFCAKIEDKVAQEQCMFDVMVTGETGFARLHARSLKLRAAFEANP